MKKIILIPIIAIFNFIAQAQAPATVFTNVYNSVGNTSDDGWATLAIGNGKVILAGKCNNTNPEPLLVRPASSTISSSGFIGQYNAVGACEWSVPLDLNGGYISQIVKDASGNIYVVGTSVGTTAFVNGVAYASVGNNVLGNANIFIAKFNSIGVVSWVKNVGAAGDEYGYTIALDNASNIYVACYSNNTGANLDFEVGNTAASISVPLKSFVVKLSTAGSFIWYRYINSFSGYAHAACVDQNNVYFASAVANNANVSPQGSAYSVTTNSSSIDMVLIKYRLDGTFVSAKTIGGASNSEYIRSIYVKNNRVVIGGAFTGPAAMNGTTSPAVNIFCNGGTNKDGFVALFDTTSFQCQWANPIGGTTATDDIYKVTIDASNNILVAGGFTGSNVNFNNNSSPSLLYSSNGNAGSDYFYGSYSLAGNCSWIYKAGGSVSDWAKDITWDNTGRIWATGYADANGGLNYAMFLNKHLCTISPTITVKHNGIALSPSGVYYSAIGCLGQNSVITLTANPNTNLKYYISNMNGVLSAANSLTINNVTNAMSSKGILMQVIDTVSQCEQVYILRYSQINTINPALSISGATLICTNSLVTLTGNQSWSGISYTFMPGGIITPPNSNFANITMSVTTTFTASVYDGIANGLGCTWSAIKTISVAPATTINIAASNPSPCTGQSLTLTATGATTYGSPWQTSNGTATLVVAPSTSTTYSVNGFSGACYGNSSITINVDTGPSLSISVSGYSICNGQSASLTASGASSYSWNTGANSPSIVVSPTTTNVYNLIGSNGNCSNTSTVQIEVQECITGILKNNSRSSTFIYPNPTNGKIKIENIENLNTQIFVRDILGNEIFNTSNSQSTEIDLSSNANGIYFVEIISSSNREIIKVIKN